jgi:hypothetical protein
MSSTAIVAILGIAGTLTAAVLTQWLTARREDRRWTREQADRARQRKREDASRWERDRFSLYSKLLLDIDAWRRAAQVGRPRSDLERERIGELQSEVGRGVYAAHLLGSSSVIEISTKIWMRVVGVGSYLDTEPEDSEAIARAVGIVETLRFDLEKLMRSELGITDAWDQKDD